MFAPGTAGDKAAPSGDAPVDHRFTSFYADLGKWLNDPTHFARNISVTTAPVYALGWSCTPEWSDPLAGFFPVSLCQPYILYVGQRVELDGVNLSALAAAIRIGPFLDGSEGPSALDLWSLSRVARSVLGVHLFGFRDDGEYNFDIPEDVNELHALFVRYVFVIVDVVDETIEAVEGYFTKHDYHVETDICVVTEETASWCTLDNIACWGRHYPAPHEDESDHEKPITNGAESEQGNCMIILSEEHCVEGFEPNPIRTAVGSEGGLPKHAIANTTLPGHWFDDENNPEGCPKKLNNDKDWKTGTPNGCSQVYREPHLEDGKIAMRTRGYGKGDLAPINDQQGPLIFGKLDEQMKGAMKEAPDHLCPELRKSE